MDKNHKKEETKNQEGLIWQTEADAELHTSEWFGAIIRYCWHFGKKEFNTLYTPKDLKKNAIIGWLFKVIMMIVLPYMGYQYFNFS